MEGLSCGSSEAWSIVWGWLGVGMENDSILSVGMNKGLKMNRIFPKGSISPSSRLINCNRKFNILGLALEKYSFRDNKLLKNLRQNGLIFSILNDY